VADVFKVRLIVEIAMEAIVFVVETVKGVILY
jgi:hypothetical protein